MICEDIEIFDREKIQILGAPLFSYIIKQLNKIEFVLITI